MWLRGSQTAAGHARMHSPNLTTTWAGDDLSDSGFRSSGVLPGLRMSGTRSPGSTASTATSAQRPISARTVSTTTARTSSSRLPCMRTPSRSTAAQRCHALRRRATILAEVARMYPHPTANAYYPVYVDQPRGNAGYCAWHSAGTINGTPCSSGSSSSSTATRAAIRTARLTERKALQRWATSAGTS